MPAPEHTTSEPWEATSDFQWTHRAYDLLEQNLLHADVSVVEGVLTTRVWGTCPRCEGLLDDRQVPMAVGDFSPVRGRADREAAALHPTLVVMDVTCGCGYAHAGAPEGTTGCGVSFRVELVAEDATADAGGTP
jgi:hypothetical protein